MPILLYHPDSICGNGIYVLDAERENVKFGMIKLGVKNENSILIKTGICISNKGKIICKGERGIGNHFMFLTALTKGKLSKVQ